MKTFYNSYAELGRSIGIVLLSTALLAGCGSSTPTLGDRMKAQGASISQLGDRWEEGKKMVTKGQDLIADGQSRVAKGEQMVIDGNRIVEETENTCRQTPGCWQSFIDAK